MLVFGLACLFVIIGGLSIVVQAKSAAKAAQVSKHTGTYIGCNNEINGKDVSGKTIGAKRYNRFKQDLPFVWKVQLAILMRILR